MHNSWAERMYVSGTVLGDEAWSTVSLGLLVSLHWFCVIQRLRMVPLWFVVWYQESEDEWTSDQGREVQVGWDYG